MKGIHRIFISLILLMPASTLAGEFVVQGIESQLHVENGQEYVAQYLNLVATQEGGCQTKVDPAVDIVYSDVDGQGTIEIFYDNEPGSGDNLMWGCIVGHDYSYIRVDDIDTGTYQIFVNSRPDGQVVIAQATADYIPPMTTKPTK